MNLILGDAKTELKRMADNSIDVVITDPPDNVVNRPTAGLREFDKGVADSEPVNIKEIAPELTRIARGSIYVWCSTEQASEWRKTFVDLGLSTRTCVWIKSNPSPANGQHMWLSGIELCIYARKKNAPFYKFCKVPVWKGKVEKVKGFKCPKPVWLMKELIEASVPPNGSVLDCYMGSGSTGVAAKLLNKEFIGIENNLEHFNLAKERLA